MALFIPSGNGGGGGTILYNNPTRHHPYTHLPHRRPPQVSLPLTPRGPALHVVSAKKFSPRTGRLDSKNRRSSTTTTKDLEKSSLDQERTAGNGSGGEVKVESVVDDDGFVIPKLPGEESDFWEGPQWDGLGFFLQYLWAFGIVFAVFLFSFLFLALSHNSRSLMFCFCFLKFPTFHVLLFMKLS
uniref:Uncharacterized protein n=1 Tax=Rhizophora mucronata TaxID=61149 RepID=A0A2P2M7B8_RHIMU